MATRRSRQSRPRCFRINHLALALALLFTGADDHEAGFPISRSVRPRGVASRDRERVQRVLESRRDTSNRTLDQSPASKPPLGDTLGERERAMIEAALAATKGRVSGPSGAAAKLGLPRSTLESKIRSLGLNKNRFKT